MGNLGELSNLRWPLGTDRERSKDQGVSDAVGVEVFGEDAGDRTCFSRAGLEEKRKMLLHPRFLNRSLLVGSEFDHGAFISGLSRSSSAARAISAYSQESVALPVHPVLMASRFLLSLPTRSRRVSRSV